MEQKAGRENEKQRQSNGIDKSAQNNHTHEDRRRVAGLGDEGRRR